MLGLEFGELVELSVYIDLFLLLIEWCWFDGLSGVGFDGWLLSNILLDSFLGDEVRLIVVYL